MLDNKQEIAFSNFPLYMQLISTEQPTEQPNISIQPAMGMNRKNMDLMTA